MKKTIFCIVVALWVMTDAYSQCACCAGAGAGSAGGDYGSGILTLAKKQLIIETYADFRHVNQNLPPVTEVNGDEEAPLTGMFIQSVGVRYGLTKGITVSALLPYVFLHTHTGNDNGVGDLVVLGTFTLISKNNFNLALQAGVELPTGIQKRAAFDNTTVIVGSGSYDPMGGIVAAKRWDKFTLQANGLYKHTTKGFQGNYYSSLAIQNVSLSYKIKEGSTLCGIDEKDKEEMATQEKSSAFGWTVSTGYYGEYLDKFKEDGIADPDSGYYMGYATFGTTLSFKTWAFPLTASLPVIQNMNGEQNTGGFRVRFGVIKSF